MVEDWEVSRLITKAFFLFFFSFRGPPWYIVTPLLVEKRLQRDGVEQEDCGGDLRSFECQQVGGAFVSAGTVFAGGVVPELVGSGFGEEIGFGREDLSLEQFGFDGVVNAFDVGVGVGAGRGIEAVLGVVFLFDGPVKAADLIVGGVAVVFGAQVGGDDDLGGVE